MAYPLAQLALDPESGDMALPFRVARGADAILQKIKIRFKFFLGEWFLDRRLGVPYFTDVLIKNPDPILINFIFRRVLRTTPGVKAVISFEASMDAPARLLTVSFEAQLEDGQVLRVEAEPFIIT